jgi:hypothetical protein
VVGENVKLPLVTGWPSNVTLPVTFAVAGFPEHPGNVMSKPTQASKQKKDASRTIEFI